MKQIFNEGRVVGLTPYEIYIRQLHLLDPTVTPMSEREWLTYTLSNNTSMILSIKAGLIPGCHDYILPQNSSLIGCSVIYASHFYGKVSTGTDGHWATSVIDYGQLIENAEQLHPVSPGYSENVPTKVNPQYLPRDFARKSKEYIKSRKKCQQLKPFFFIFFYFFFKKKGD